VTVIKVLDAFCCEGVATLGIIKAFHNAGYEVHVTGVDIVSRFARRYRGDTFVTADAVDYIGNEGHKFDFRWTSPPCQRYTRGNAMNDTTGYPDLIGVTRDALHDTGKPYVIENVSDARPMLIDPIVLCGTMFGLSAIDTDGTPLEMRRHRLFETDYDAAPPSACAHGWFSTQVAGVYGGARKDKVEARTIRKGGYVPPDRQVKETLLGVPHNAYTLHGLNQSIPPRYAEHMVNEFLTGT